MRHVVSLFVVEPSPDLCDVNVALRHSHRESALLLDERRELAVGQPLLRRDEKSAGSEGVPHRVASGAFGRLVCASNLPRKSVVGVVLSLTGGGGVASHETHLSSVFRATQLRTDQRGDRLVAESG